MISFDLKISKKDISFFHDFFGLKQEIGKSERDASSNLAEIKLELDLYSKQVTQIIGGVFGQVDLNVVVSVLPKYYRIGATKTDEAKILLGHEPRNEVYNVAILAHEVAHIILEKDNTEPPVVKEAVCFVLEGLVYQLVSVKLTDVWSKEELDNYHRLALSSADAYLENSRGKDGLRMLIKDIRKNLPISALRLKPVPGLLNNIKT